MSQTPTGFVYFSRMITRIKENAIRQNAKQICFLLEQYLTSPSKPLTLTQISYCRNLLLYIDDPVMKNKLSQMIDNHFAKIVDNEKIRNPPLIQRHNGAVSITPSYDTPDIELGPGYFN